MASHGGGELRPSTASPFNLDEMLQGGYGEAVVALSNAQPLNHSEHVLGGSDAGEIVVMVVGCLHPLKVQQRHGHRPYTARLYVAHVV